MTPDEYIRTLIGDYVVKLAMVMAERDELAVKVATLEAEKATEPASG